MCTIIFMIPRRITRTGKRRRYLSAADQRGDCNRDHGEDEYALDITSAISKTSAACGY